MISLQSFNPATNELIWQGEETSPSQLENMIASAKKSFSSWSLLDLEARYAILLRFKEVVEAKKEVLAIHIAEETGKPHWESLSEVNSVIQKVAISHQAHLERCAKKSTPIANQTLELSFKPHGVLSVFGPFNFPLHLPNGHIIPALLAGNCVIFKPSEKTPRSALAYEECFIEAGLPDGVFSIALGGKEIGQALAKDPEINGLLFTGSLDTGLKLNQLYAENPQKILALEMGGNNPLLISSFDDLDAVCYLTIQSAFLTAGQRCSATRRLILTRGAWNAAFIQRLIEMTSRLKIGPHTDRPEPFMGPLID
jgi:succinylglutamic semialdehyde dehydrogenase